MYADRQQAIPLAQMALRVPTLEKYPINGSEMFSSRAFISITEKDILIRRPLTRDTAGA